MTNPLAFIIEDDPKLSTIYDMVLQQAGYVTEIIRRGDEARTRLASATPELILLDVHLPYVSGAELLQQIRADSRTAYTPVIILTADIYSAKTMSLEGHANHVLVKSFGVSQLRSLIAREYPGGMPSNVPSHNPSTPSES
jgi:two-component system, OmpR family, alkaline phosphatase synthesis response regulator PhoP